jgi:arginine-tRNA-protein transferase
VEKLELYQRYQTHWHGKVSESEEDSWAAMVSFLYESPVQSLEFTYRTPDQELVAVGIADVCSRSFSSVYFYFDPKHSARGLGTFGALQELQWAHQHQIPQYYLGFWVNGCGKMAYKTAFRPYQLLDANGVWQDG